MNSRAPLETCAGKCRSTWGLSNKNDLIGQSKKTKHFYLFYWYCTECKFKSYLSVNLQGQASLQAPVGLAQIWGDVAGEKLLALKQLGYFSLYFIPYLFQHIQLRRLEFLKPPHSTTKEEEEEETFLPKLPHSTAKEEEQEEVVGVEEEEEKEEEETL